VEKQRLKIPTPPLVLTRKDSTRVGRKRRRRVKKNGRGKKEWKSSKGKGEEALREAEEEERVKKVRTNILS